MVIQEVERLHLHNISVFLNAIVLPPPLSTNFPAALNEASSSLPKNSYPTAWEVLKIMRHPEFPR